MAPDSASLVVMKLRRLIQPFTDSPNSTVYWAFGLVWLATGPLVLVGMATVWRRSPAQTLLLLAVPKVLTVMVAMIFYGCARFRNSVAPVFVIFAVVGLARLLEPIGQLIRQHALFIGQISSRLGRPIAH